MMQLRGAIIFLIFACGLDAAAAETTNNNDPEIRKVIEDYCTSVSDLAAERRSARQTSALKELESEVGERLNILDERTRELGDLLRKRDELRNLAQKELVEIYAGMDAEAAAAQMGKLDIRLASSLLRQLKPRQASSILNVMKPELAAQMVRMIAVDAADLKVAQ
ncbi:hypothetical protein [Aestuariivirga sp.]|uniref:MotE family protein n=1 Tax=Aestuariivirga sp. TaxID=2650926 RepID=UPI0030158E7E